MIQLLPYSKVYFIITLSHHLPHSQACRWWENANGVLVVGVKKSQNAENKPFILLEIMPKTVCQVDLIWFDVIFPHQLCLISSSRVDDCSSRDGLFFPNQIWRQCNVILLGLQKCVILVEVCISGISPFTLLRPGWWPNESLDNKVKKFSNI